MNTGKIKSRCGKAATCSMRLVSLMFLALFAFVATSTWAATPVAVWDGDFTATQTGFTLNRSGNAISQDNSTITIDQSVGVKVDFTTGFSDAMTVMFKYSDLAFDAQKTLATSFCSGGDENRTGVYAASGGTINGIWNTANWNNPMGTLSESSGVLAFCYSKTAGTSLYSVGASSRSELYNKSGLRAGGDAAINGCTIGGERAKSGATLLSAATGMKITGIAIFDGILTEAEMTGYIWPSEIQTINVSANTSVSAINAQYDSTTYKVAKVTVASGVTITVDAAFSEKIQSVSSTGSITLSAASQPDVSYNLANVDFSGVQGALVRSWITAGVVGFNFRSSSGNDVSGALATDDNWIHDNNSANGTSTAMFSDGLSTLTWSASGTYASGVGSSITTGYLDDNASQSPVIKLSSVPYATYDIIIYCSTDSSNFKFSGKEVNGTLYTWDGSKTVTTTDENAAWGLSKSETIVEGTNALRVKNLSGPLTIKGGKYSNNGTLKCRSCIAAFEIINTTTHEATISSGGEYTLAGLFTYVNSGDNYIINVNESATLNIGSATKVRDITFNVASGKTLTLTGSSTLTATTINVNGDGMVATSSGSSLAGTVKGNGTLYYNGVRPTTTGTDVVLTDSDWRGTVRITYNYTNTATGGARALYPQYWGGANSKIIWNGVAGYFGGCTSAAGWILEDLDADGTTYPALKKIDGSSSATTTVPSLEGTGTFADMSAPTERFKFANAENFMGTINITSGGMNVQFGASEMEKLAKAIDVLRGTSVTVASGNTWSAPGGITVDGTLTLADSTSSLSGTISGTGEIVANRYFPVPGSSFTGTLTINGDPTNGTTTDATAIYGSRLNVASGMVGVTGNVTTLPSAIDIQSGASFWVYNSSITSLSVALGMWDGELNLLGCTGLTELSLNVGTERSITVSKLKLPSSATLATVNVVVKESHGDGGSITLTSTAGLPAVEGRTYNYSVLREDGETVSASLSDGVLTYAPAISGAATMYDATFNNSSQSTPQFTYKRSSGASIGLDTAVAPKYNNSENDKTTGLYLRHHPYVNGATSDIHGLTDFTVVVVGQMSPTHKTQFIHIGSTLNSNKGLLIATTDKDDEVIIVPNTGKTVDANNYVKVTVPNAASARHAYVIIKSGNVFTVWVDGIKRGNFTVAAGWEIGSSAHAGVQVGSDFGGEIQRDTSDPDRYKSVANSLDETGVINLIRIFDYVVSDAQAQAIVAEYPYVSEGGLYTRTISSDANLSATDAWAKDGSAVTYALPEGATVDNVFYNPSVTMTVGDDATLTVNANLTVDTLTVESTGGNTLTVVSNGEYSVHVSGAAVVNSPLRIAYGALDLVGPPVQLGSSGAICFDFSTMDVSQVYVGERIQLTGLIERNDEKITAIMPTDGSYELVYNTTGSCYDLVVKGIKIEMEQRAGGANVKLEVTSELLTSLVNNGLSPTAPVSDVNKFLNATDPNGLLRWENLVTGTATNQPPLGTVVSAETASGKALKLSVKMVSDTNETAKVDFGYTVLRELRKGDGTRVAGPSPDGTAFDIGLLDSAGTSTRTSGVYRVVTLLAYGSVTNEIPSTNAIGIVEVASTATNTITAVPWKRLASAPGEASDLTVSNFVAFANLSVGDKVYMLDGRDYKMWTKKSDGTWGKATTVSGDGVSEPDAAEVATIPCGGAVWVQRTDATKPYFLVGQYDESAFRVTVPGSGTVMIANPFPTNVTLNAINWGRYVGVTNDTIRIRNPEKGLYVGLSFDGTNGKWGQYIPTIVGGAITGKTFNPYNGVIPAGTGFIYDRKGGEGFTFEWK